MTNKRGTVKLFTFSFEIDAPNIISCAHKTWLWSNLKEINFKDKVQCYPESLKLLWYSVI